MSERLLRAGTTSFSRTCGHSKATFVTKSVSSHRASAGGGGRAGVAGLGSGVCGEASEDCAGGNTPGPQAPP